MRIYRNAKPNQHGNKEDNGTTTNDNDDETNCAFPDVATIPGMNKKLKASK